MSLADQRDQLHMWALQTTGTAMGMAGERFRNRLAAMTQASTVPGVGNMDESCGCDVLGASALYPAPVVFCGGFFGWVVAFRGRSSYSAGGKLEPDIASDGTVDASAVFLSGLIILLCNVVWYGRCPTRMLCCTCVCACACACMCVCVCVYVCVRRH